MLLNLYLFTKFHPRYANTNYIEVSLEIFIHLGKNVPFAIGSIININLMLSNRNSLIFIQEIPVFNLINAK